MRSHHGYTAPGDDAFLHSNWSSEPKSRRAKRTSKEKLIRAARNLMLAQGYPITSVDDLSKPPASVREVSITISTRRKSSPSLRCMNFSRMERP
jgi:hypothetical protein